MEQADLGLHAVALPGPGAHMPIMFVMAAEMDHEGQDLVDSCLHLLQPSTGSSLWELRGPSTSHLI